MNAPLGQLEVFGRIATFAFLGMVLADPAFGLQVTGYSSAENDRFSSGFPTAPVENGDASFVGAGLDWSGVGWSTNLPTDSNRYKSHALLSPRHFLTAQHFEGGGNLTEGLNLLDRQGAVRTSTTKTVINLGVGIILAESPVPDISLGILDAPIADAGAFERLPVLDLHTSSTAYSFGNYVGLDALLYGRGSSINSSPRIGITPILIFLAPGGDLLQSTIQTTRDDVQLEGGDSASPALHAWNDPNGNDRLTVLGIHSAIDTDNNLNFSSFAATPVAMNAANQVMNTDGYTLWVVGNPGFTWEGNTSQRLDRNVAWGLGGNPNASGATTDQYVLFDGAVAIGFNPTVDAATNLRGLYFKETISADPFTFGGSAILTVGRGGVTNYDQDQQIFNAPLALGAPQFWDAGPGGLTISDLDTGGHLLEVRAGGGSTVSGVISGAGSVALESGALTLSGSSTYTGDTWVHEGNLRVDGSIASSTEVMIATAGTLSGAGVVPVLSGEGLVSPGTSAGILTAAGIDPVSGLDFAFTIQAESSLPDFGNGTASINDLVRLTSGIPFPSALDSSNTLSLFIDATSLAVGEIYYGGFFTDTASDFTSTIENASVRIYLSDPDGTEVFEGGTYSITSGDLIPSFSTIEQTADFGTGLVNGRLLRMTMIWNPARYAGWENAVFPPEVSEADRLPGADPNQDGVVNEIVYALDLDPLATPLDQLPSAIIEPDGDNGEFVFQFRRNRIAEDLTMEVWLSDDLIVWNPSGIEPEVIDPDIDGDGSAELVEVRVPLGPGELRKFARLQTSLN